MATAVTFCTTREGMRAVAPASLPRPTGADELVVGAGMKRFIPLAVVAAGLAAAPSANAAVSLSGGDTRLTLDKGTAKALTSLGVAVSPTGPARAQGRHVRFPISGGSIDPASAAGTINHRGGLRFKAGKTKVTLKDYRVTVGSKIRLSARLGNARVTILDLTGTPSVTRDGFNTNVSGLTARLNRTAARALNGAFGVTAFKKGLKLGKVTRQVRDGRDGVPRPGRHRPGARRRRTDRDRRPGRHARHRRPGHAGRHHGALPDHGRLRGARPQRRRDHPLGRHLADRRRDRRHPDGLRHPRRRHQPAALRVAQRRRDQGRDHRSRPDRRDAGRERPHGHARGRDRTAHPGRGRRAQRRLRRHRVRRRPRARQRDGHRDRQVAVPAGPGATRARPRCRSGSS